jgi:hypothetical protein
MKVTKKKDRSWREAEKLEILTYWGSFFFPTEKK